MKLRADLESGLRRYPPGSDVELIAALKHSLEESGCRPEELDERAGLHPGTVAALLAGYQPSGPLLRRLCQELRKPLWLFHLTGTVVFGADIGYRDLEELVERRRRHLAGNPDQITETDLVVEAVEILLAIGEDGGARGSAAASRRGLCAGLKRLARCAERLGELGAACLLGSIAAVVLEGVESLSGAELETVIHVVDLARSLEDRAAAGAT